MFIFLEDVKVGNLFSFERSVIFSKIVLWKLDIINNMFFLLVAISSICMRLRLRKNKSNKIKNTKFYEVKLIRAYSECLGIRRRRRTRLPAKSDGELDVSFDPSISEWGNPVEVIFHHPAACAAVKKHLGKWNISVPRGKEREYSIPSVAASESGTG